MTRGDSWYENNMHWIEYICDQGEDSRYIYGLFGWQLNKEFTLLDPVVWIEPSIDKIVISSVSGEKFEYGIKRFEETYEEFYPGKLL